MRTLLPIAKSTCQLSRLVRGRSWILARVYVIPIHVPIMMGPSGPTVSVTWGRSLELLRDSLGDYYGQVVVVAPWGENTNDEPLATDLADIRLLPVHIPSDTPEFWWSGRAGWSRQVSQLFETARVLHTTVGYTWRPFPFLAHRAAVRAGVPTVFVQDMDKGVAIRQSGGRLAPVHAAVYERMVGRCVRSSRLSLLKGPDLMQKYGALAPGALEILDTSHSRLQVIALDDLEHRLAMRSRTLRLVFAGRLVSRKRVDLALRFVAAVRRAGRPVDLAIYGDGPERDDLAEIAKELGVDDAVEFHGYAAYDELLLELRSYDAQILPSPVEDTPRSVFDGYAAGLPLLAAPTSYTRTRAQIDQAVVFLGEDEVAVAAYDRLVIDLVALSRSAMQAGLANSAEQWYLRRAQATFEAIP
jgi:glycosyltransferase involved in cell wall biosynthesis